MSLDRDLQRKILQHLATSFPQHSRRKDVYPDPESQESEIYNMHYLHGHGLLEIKTEELNRVPAARITSAGLDFLEGDGGLTAILGVVTVKLHDDTIRAMLLDRISAAPDGDPSMRAELESTVRQLPGEVLKTVTLNLVEKGLSGMTLSGLATLFG